ncbi:MAG: hypothetical protein SOY68_09710 [Fusobacterium varium]|jgi:hypothetical protein|nr:hypothetical protein [Fusobacterium varium]MCI6031206.1 hypothetical protein [Fusobacterium varium]MDY4006173.1 hypothetical protein [Fusobacterium varium]DAE74119.1 MAG TPA: LPXTG cell wall anchor motif domain protein [Caudoviricetes sp.]
MTTIGYCFLGLIIVVCGIYLYFRGKDKEYNSAINNNKPTMPQPKIKKK